MKLNEEQIEEGESGRKVRFPDLPLTKCISAGATGTFVASQRNETQRHTYSVHLNASQQTNAAH
jgi:hypothetical protein